MNIADLFAKTNAISTPDVAVAFKLSEVVVREWAFRLRVTKIGVSFAWTRPDVEKLERGLRASAPAPATGIGRVGFSIAEAASALGKRPDALRRLVEHHAVTEGDELVARLTGGIVARRRKDLARWLVTIPVSLREE